MPDDADLARQGSDEAIELARTLSGPAQTRAVCHYASTILVCMENLYRDNTHREE
jgi:hypothetical protein